MTDKVRDSTSASVKGSFTLLLGNMIALAVNAIGAIIVAQILTPTEYGLFTTSLVLPSFFNLFTSWGVNQALTRFIAQNKTKNNLNIKELIRVGYFFTFITSLFLTGILFFFADPLARIVLNKPEVGEYLRLASILTLSQSTFNTGIAIFAGFEKMTHRASVMVLQSAIKGSFSPVLSYLGFGVIGVVAGHTLSYAIPSIAAIIMVILILKDLNIEKSGEPFLKNLKFMIGYGMPIFISQILVGSAAQIRGVLLSRFIQYDLIGNYGISTWFTSLILGVTASIRVTLFPTFSKYNITQETKSTKEIYGWSIRYASMLLIPLTLMIFAASEPMIFVLFGSKYPEAARYLRLLLIPTLFIGLGSLSNASLLDSQGETRATLTMTTFGFFSTIILSYILIQFWGIEGLIIGKILSDLSQNLLGIKLINKILNIQPNLNHSIKTLFSSIIAGIIPLLQQNYVKTPHPIIDLTLTVILFFTTYLVVAPLAGAIERKDLENLDAMFRNLGILYPLARIFLDLEEKLVKQREMH